MYTHYHLHVVKLKRERERKKISIENQIRCWVYFTFFFILNTYLTIEKKLLKRTLSFADERNVKLWLAFSRKTRNLSSSSILPQLQGMILCVECATLRVNRESHKKSWSWIKFIMEAKISLLLLNIKKLTAHQQQQGNFSNNNQKVFSVSSYLRVSLRGEWKVEKGKKWSKIVAAGRFDPILTMAKIYIFSDNSCQGRFLILIQDSRNG